MIVIEIFFHRDRNIFIIVKLFLLTEFFLSPSCRVSFRGSVCVAVSWFCGSPIFRHFRVVLFFSGVPLGFVVITVCGLTSVVAVSLRDLFLHGDCFDPDTFFLHASLVIMMPKKTFLTLDGIRFFL